MVNKVEFAERLVEYRGRCGWSQGELAAIMGMHRNTIASWESGTIPSRGVVLRLTDRFSLSQEERKGFLEAAGVSSVHWRADYWNVAYQRNPYFVGRETVLQSLRQALVPGAFTQSISGLGGIGKTQVAIEYAHRYGASYEAVLWVSADSQELATTAYLQLATEVLGLPEQQEAEQQIVAVKRWLQKHPHWLLIFDNVEDLQAILSTFVPSKHQGSVLITTRKRATGKLAHNEVLSVLSEDKAILFLLRRAGCITMNACEADATAVDLSLARDVCQLLGYLPLALDQAGAYIEENGGLLKNYMDLYYQYRPSFLDRRDASTQRGSRHREDHPDSVFMTFRLSWEQIKKHNVVAGQVLQFCAFLAPDRIPESLLRAGIKLSGEGRIPNEMEVDEALGLLYRYSLIARTEQTLSLHRLVQEVLQDVLCEEERYQWMEKALMAVDAIFPSGEYGTWPLCEILLPHALICVKWIKNVRQRKFEGMRLLSATGLYLYERGQYREAEPLYKRAIAIAEEQLDSYHLETAIILNNLASLYESQGCYGEAELFGKRALSIRNEQLGFFHPDTAASLNNLASVNEKLGRYGEAELLYQQALTISERQLGTSHPQTATATYLNNLALLYVKQGRYGEAEPLYRRSLFILQEQLEHCS